MSANETYPQVSSRLVQSVNLRGGGYQRQCQQARTAVQLLIDRRLLEHLRFQHMHAESLETPWRLDRQELHLRLNPIRLWAPIAAPWPGVDRSAVRHVLFFATRDAVASAVLELEGQALLNELEDWEPCTISEWAALTKLADRRQLTSFCHDLLQMGMLAWS